MSLLRIALRNLARNRRRTALCIAAIVFGVVAAVAARGFVTAQHRALLDAAVHGDVGAIQVHREGYSRAVHRSPLEFRIEDSENLRQRISAVEGVVAVAPRIHFGAMLAMPEVEGAEEPPPSTYLQLTAIDPSVEFRALPSRTQALNAGAWPRDSEDKGLVLHRELARALELAPGAAPANESLWPALLATDPDGAIRGELVYLKGTVDNLAPGDTRFGIVPLKTAQSLLGMEGHVTGYAVRVEELHDLEQTRAALASALGEGWEVKTWRERLPHVRELVETQDAVFDAFTLIFLFVALLGVVNAQLMSVMERIPEIGTMLALGTRRAQVRRLFLLEGAFLGALGAALGIAAGGAVVVVMHHLGIRLPLAGASADVVLRPAVTATYLGLVFAAVALGATASAAWPAARASRLRPVEALRIS
ncbi:MAG: FtsX-like permease family protein [Myxococcaceae bacterium]